MSYVKIVREYEAATPGGVLLVEQRLPITSMTGEPDAYGTSDVVIIGDEEYVVIDLKYGRGVEVDAENNWQLMMYALSVVRQFDLAGSCKQVRLVIVQPRIYARSEWVVSVEDLEAFGDRVMAASLATQQPDAALVPTEKGCRWCRAKADCPAIRNEVLDAFESLDAKTVAPDQLGIAMGKVELIEGWCKAIRAKTETELLAGKPVDGWKLVTGKKGNRKWTNEADAIAALKKAKLKKGQMYQESLISPTTAQKLLDEAVVTPKQWEKIRVCITQSDGQPSVAPAKDKRPAIALGMTADDFVNLDL